MDDYSEELAAVHGTRIYGSSSEHTYSYEDFKDVVRNNIAEEFLPEYLKADN